MDALHAQGTPDITPRWLVPVPDVGALAEAAGAAIHGAQNEICLLLRGRLEERRLAPEPALTRAASRGVRLRAVQETGTQARSPACDMRRVPSVPTQLLIADQRVALVFNGPVGFAVGRSPLLTVLIETFEFVWEHAETPVTGGGPSARDRAILELLAAGLGDEAVAAQLGGSARTVRRRVAYLMSQTGASTRFQTAVEATRRGWI